MKDDKKKSLAGLALSISGAWVTVPILGIVLILFSSVVGNSIVGDYTDGQDVARFVLLNSVVGLIALAIIVLAVWNARRRVYVHHLLIGLWIGIGLYGLMLVGGTVGVLSGTLSEAGNSIGSCSSAQEQYAQHASAVVPIRTNLGSGTAFAIDPGGTLLTAYHVVAGARTVVASYSSGEVPIEVLSTAPEYDLALLKLGEPTPNHFNITSSYSTTDLVYAYGYPGNALEAGPPSLSGGIVSRVLTTADLRMTDGSFPDGLEIIQTDAAINPGNSGGPLIGKCGVIGVVQSISDSSQLSRYIGVVSEQGIGYAVSVKSAALEFNLPIYDGR